MLCLFIYLSVCLSVCMRAMAGQTAGPVNTKLGMGTHVDPGSVLVTWHRLAKANKTPYRGPQGPRESRPAGPRQLRLEDGYLQLVFNKRNERMVRMNSFSAAKKRNKVRGRLLRLRPLRPLAPPTMIMRCCYTDDDDDAAGVQGCRWTAVTMMWIY